MAGCLIWKETGWIKELRSFTLTETWKRKRIVGCWFWKRRCQRSKVTAASYIFSVLWKTYWSSSGSTQDHSSATWSAESATLTGNKNWSFPRRFSAPAGSHAWLTPNTLSSRCNMARCAEFISRRVHFLRAADKKWIPPDRNDSRARNRQKVDCDQFWQTDLIITIDYW